MNLSLRNPLSIFLVFGICANALAGEALRVSSFSNVLSEIAAGVGCDTVKVHAHVKPGGDPHGFQPKPAERTVFKQNSERYLSELDALKHWANAKVAELPRAGRRLVTSQDAFQYFSRDFGFTIYAIEGITTADQPSAEKVTRIIEEIRLRKVKAVFPERIENPKVLRKITRESGAAVGPMLYADGLGGGAAATYAGMYRHNVAAIVDSLK